MEFPPERYQNQAGPDCLQCRGALLEDALSVGSLYRHRQQSRGFAKPVLTADNQPLGYSVRAMPRQCCRMQIATPVVERI